MEEQDKDVFKMCENGYESVSMSFLYESVKQLIVEKQGLDILIAIHQIKIIARVFKLNYEEYLSMVATYSEGDLIGPIF